MDDEIPPRWMWSLDHELKPWFEEVQRNRDEKYGTNSDKDKRESVPMMENELSRRR